MVRESLFPKLWKFICDTYYIMLNLGKSHVPSCRNIVNRTPQANNVRAATFHEDLAFGWRREGLSM